MMAFVVLMVGGAFVYVCFRVGTACVAAVRAIGMPFTEAMTASVSRELAVRERLAAVEERRITLEELARRPKPPAVPMPPDLRARLAMLDADWARDDEERTMRSLYAELDDWDLVRAQLRPLAPVLHNVDHPFVEAFPG